MCDCVDGQGGVMGAWFCFTMFGESLALLLGMRKNGKKKKLPDHTVCRSEFDARRLFERTRRREVSCCGGAALLRSYAGVTSSFSLLAGRSSPHDKQCTAACCVLDVNELQLFARASLSFA